MKRELAGPSIAERLRDSSARFYKLHGPALLAGLLKDCLDEIILYPDQLSIQVMALGGSTDALEVVIVPAPGDVKRLIGTGGVTVQAIRKFCQLWGNANGASVIVANFNIPKDSRDRYQEFKSMPAWPRERLMDILKRMAESVAGEEVNIQCVPGSYPAASHIVLRYCEARHAAMRRLHESLHILGNAMGKKNGHTLSVHVRPETSCAPLGSG